MSAGRLWYRALSVPVVLALVGAFLSLALRPLVLDLEPEEAALARTSAFIFLSLVFVAVVLWTAVILRRVTSLWRGGGSDEAAAAAFALPADFLRGASTLAAGGIAGELGLHLWLGRLEPIDLLSMSALSLALSGPLLVLGYILIRRSAISALQHSPPRAPEGSGGGGIQTKLILALVVPVATLGVVLALSQWSADARLGRRLSSELRRDLEVMGARGGMQRTAPSLPTGWPWALVALAAGASAFVALRLADRVAQDLRRIVLGLDSLSKGERTAAALPSPKNDSTRGRSGSLGSHRFAEMQQLEDAIAAMDARLDEISRTQALGIQARAEAQRLKTQFLASMSHDLRSPLNSIIGFSELLLRGIEGPLQPQQRETIHIIHKSGNDLLRLINDILDSSKLEAGRMDIDKEWTPSVEILNETIKRSREFIGDKQIELHAELQPGLPPVYVDADRMSQAILNIIANAFKFMERGTVRVRACVGRGAPGLPERYLQVEIADTGTGIREEDREHIFEAFSQVDSSSTRRIGGMGLGLSLARSIVELHGGKVWVDSKLGAGSTFYLAVPIGE